MTDAEKDDWLDPLDSQDDKDISLDQADFDTVLFAAKDQEQQVVTPNAPPEDELDQSAIDALLSGSDDIFSAEVTTSSTAETIDLGQPDIDDLLASPLKPAPSLSVSDPDQDEIDKLFADIDNNGASEENQFLAEEFDFKGVTDSNDLSPQNTNLDFDTEEFKFDTDIPDIPPDNQDKQSFDFNLPSSAEEPVTGTILNKPPVQATQAPRPSQAEKRDLKPKGIVIRIRELLVNRKMLFSFGGGLAVLIILAGVFFMKGGTKAPEPTIIAAQHEPETNKPLPAASPPPEPAAPPSNSCPIVENMELNMPPESSQLLITIKGTDPEGEPLEYEFQSMPAHGQLAGHAPNLIYTPKPDFTGTDTFTIRATDGKNISPTASIKITRLATTIVKDIPPEQTQAVSPVAKKTKKVSKSKGQPRNMLSQKRANLHNHTLPANVQQQNRAPILHLQPIDQSYATADTVILNASQTTDEKRETLTFRWEQLPGGVPVLIKPLTKDKSQVAFVVPSSFNTVTNPQIYIKVTASDQEGASDSKEITIHTNSRRSSAIWKGNP